uniref:condensation domain-containing protein n=1 Tax=uncultured Shewanella sp. TaxID=173975 RepID=UPI002631D3BB
MMNIIYKVYKNDAAVWVLGDDLKAAFSKNDATGSLKILIRENISLVKEFLRENKVESRKDFLLYCRKVFSQCSFAQERLWFIERYEQGTDSYHIPYIATLKDDTDEGALVRAITKIIARHPVLNSTYHQTDEGDCYTQLRSEGIIVDHQILGDRKHLMECLKNDVKHPFDLSFEAPFRMCRYDCDGERFLLLLWHHIAFDGWSSDVFVRELSELYQAEIEQRPAQLPELSISYSDYAQWQRDHLTGEVLDEQLQYWREQLSGYEPLGLLTDYPRPAQVSYVGEDIDFVLNAELSQALRESAKQRDTTLYSLLLSGFYLLLSRVANQQDIVIGTPSDNRHYTHTHDLIGFFVNSLALRTRVAPEQDIDSFVEQVHQVVMDAKVHQELPFEKLISELDIERDPSRHPLFQVMFGVHRFGNNPVEGEFPLVSQDMEKLGYTPAKFDISLLLDAGQASIHGKWNFANALYDNETIVHYQEMYIRVLSWLVNSSGQTIKQVDVLSNAEKEKLLYQWNDTNSAYPQEKT